VVADASAEDLYRQEVRIDATPDTVFDFFVDAAYMLRWMGVDAELDAQPGGEFRVDVNGRDVAVGEYVEVNRPHRVAFTLGWLGSADMPPGSTRVEVTLTPEDGGTLLLFQHRLVPADRLAQHAEGWGHFLPRLMIAATGGDPGPDPWLVDTPH
jgi:uncharacterized protein YndB with AHSA1/START domain